MRHDDGTRIALEVVTALTVLATVACRGSRARRDEPFQFWGACTEMPGGEIIHYITDPEREQEITYQTFARNVDLGPMRRNDHPAMYRISAPDNWAISFYKSELPNGDPIYFFAWSGIEHIFVDPNRDWPDPHEMNQLAIYAGH